MARARTRATAFGAALSLAALAFGAACSALTGAESIRGHLHLHWTSLRTAVRAGRGHVERIRGDVQLPVPGSRLSRDRLGADVRLGLLQQRNHPRVPLRRVARRGPHLRRGSASRQRRVRVNVLRPGARLPERAEQLVRGSVRGRGAVVRGRAELPRGASGRRDAERGLLRERGDPGGDVRHGVRRIAGGRHVVRSRRDPAAHRHARRLRDRPARGHRGPLQELRCVMELRRPPRGRWGRPPQGEWGLADRVEPAAPVL